MDSAHRFAPHALSALIAASLSACIATLLTWGSATGAVEDRSVVGAESTGAVVLAVAMVALAVGAWMHWSELHWLQPVAATVLALVIVVVSVMELRTGYAADQAGRLLDGAAVSTALGGGVWLSLAAGLVMAVSALVLVAATRRESVTDEYAGLVLMPSGSTMDPAHPRGEANMEQFVRAAGPDTPPVQAGHSAVRAAGLSLAPMVSYPLAGAACAATTVRDDPQRTTVVEPADAVLVVRDANGTEHTRVLNGHTTIGRRASNDVVVDDGFASSDHAEIHRRPLGWELLDMGSTNGTTRNGAPVTSRTLLEKGDRIEIGKTVLTFA